jgi:site-specific DNA recombinase
MVKTHFDARSTLPVSSFTIKRDLTKLLANRGPRKKGVPNKYLVQLIRKARRAQQLLDERYDGTITEIATKLHCTHVRLPRLVRLNYLAPDIIAAILDGTQPAGLTGFQLMSKELPLDWALQRRLLGFAEQPDAIRAAPGWQPTHHTSGC